MKKIKFILPCFVALLFLFLFLPMGSVVGFMNSDELLASKWITVNSSVGYLYDETQNIDSEVDAKGRGLTTETISDDNQWNTPLLRYSEIRLDVQFTGKMLGLAFEFKTDIVSSFEIKVEAQIYKQVQLPENWDKLTQEEKEQWEQENCIQDKQFASTTVSSRSDVSFTFDEAKANVDQTYQIRIIFKSIDEKAITDSSNYLKNFMVDNFIAVVETN